MVRELTRLKYAAPRARAGRAPPPPEWSCAGPPSQQVCADASRHTSSATTHAVEMAREGVPLIVIQRQLGHSNLGITSVYLQGIDNAEIIETVHARRAPMMPAADEFPGLSRS
jgi:integrase